MRCMELPGTPVSGQGRRYRGTPAGMPRAHWLLLGCAYLVDFGAAGGAHSAGCGLAILHGHLLWSLISVFALHFMQYPVTLIASPL